LATALATGLEAGFAAGFAAAFFAAAFAGAAFLAVVTGFAVALGATVGATGFAAVVVEVEFIRLLFKRYIQFISFNRNFQKPREECTKRLSDETQHLRQALAIFKLG
jgi:dolichol kinase